MSSLEPYGILVSKWNEEIKALEILKKGIYKMRLSEEGLKGEKEFKKAIVQNVNKRYNTHIDWSEEYEKIILWKSSI